MDKETEFDQIENYLAGNLSDEELAAFEQRLQQEPALAEKVSLFRNMDIALSDSKGIEVQKQLQDLGQEFFEASSNSEAPIARTIDTTAKVVPFYRKPWAIAAGVALAASVGGGIWQMQDSSALSNDQLFAQNYEVYQLDAQVRGATTNEELANAYNLYQKKSYKSAAEVLALLNSQDIDNQEIMFALANAYLNQNPPNLEKAAQFFQQLIDMNTSIYVPKSQWYLALIELKQGKLESAKLLLQEVIDSGDTKVVAARTLLEKLK